MTRQQRGQSVLGALGIVLATIVLVAGVAFGLAYMFPGPPKKVAPVKNQAQLLQDEIRVLERLLQEELVAARQAGKPEAEIDAMKERFRSELERLNKELENLHPAVPGSGNGL
jgi:hypothetical protein